MDDISRSYQVFGLQPGASLDAVKQSYRDLVRVWHPDRFAHDERLRQIAQDKLKEINGAYKVLETHFFEAAAQREAESAPGATSNAEEASTSEFQPAGRSRVVVFSAAGAMLLILLAAAALVSTRWGGRTSSDARSAGLPGEKAGAIRHALSFDGVQSRLLIAPTSSLRGTFTIECWALTRRPKGTETIVSSRGPKDYAFDIKFREGKRFHADIGNGSSWLMKMANATFRYNPDIWYHIAYVVTPTNYTVYVNGDFWTSGPLYPPGRPMLFDPDHQLIFGADSIDSAPLNGCVADVRVWSTARTAGEIKTNMNQGLTGSEAGLRGYWRFDEGQGLTASDSSGCGLVGTLVGSVTWSTNLPPALRE